MMNGRAGPNTAISDHLENNKIMNCTVFNVRLKYITFADTVFKCLNLPSYAMIVFVHSINLEITVMHFFPIFYKTRLKFPILWVMFPKYWEKLWTL